MSLYPERVKMIEDALTAAFAPQRLEVVDQSHRHAGHEGARSGGGHFDVLIVAEAFAGKKPVERHRMVYAAMGEAMHHEIHALGIKALAPGEH